MTYTKQPRSLPVIDVPSAKNTVYLPELPVKTDNLEEDNVSEDVISIYHSLSKLYTKLQKLNSALIQHKQEGKGDSNEN